MRRAWTLLTAVSLALGALGGAVATAAPAQAEGQRIVSGWLPYWMTSPARPAGVANAVANADVISEVMPFWYSAVKGGPAGVTVRTNPNFGNASANIAWAMGQLRGAGLRILPAIADASGKGTMAATLADPAKRTMHIADIVNLVVSNNYDGIDLDYEIFAFSDGRASWAATQPNWTAFVNELSAALRAQGKLLSVTIPPQCDTRLRCGPTDGYWVYNMAGIAPAADRIRIMAYDFSVHGIGPIAPMPWVRGIATNAAQIMPPSKVFIGVPTYGRVWTLKTGSRYRLAGTCPAPGTSAYRSLTDRASVTDADIPKTLADVGVDPATIQWDPNAQETWVEYDKNVTWTDASGASQTCTARRIMWWVGPQAVLARTQLVGELGLGGASMWTIGGDDPAQWPLIRTYAQQLAPAGTQVAVTASAPRVAFNTPLTVSANAKSAGAPVTGGDATLQFQAAGAADWANVAAAPLAADGNVSFTVNPTAAGAWRVFIPSIGGRPEQASDPIPVEVASAVTANARKKAVKPLKTTMVRVVSMPATAGQQVVVQRRNGAKWKTVAQGVTDASGVAMVPVRVIKKRGLYTYRAVAQAAGPLSQGVSPTFTVRVR